MTLEQVFDSIKIAIVVGTLLSLINQYDSLMAWNLSNKDVLRIFLNYLVPFCVASISRSMHIKKEERKKL
ncbi:MAG: nitrate/nitrite transporter NrtS [Ekhidna sp.]